MLQYLECQWDCSCQDIWKKNHCNCKLQFEYVQTTIRNRYSKEQPYNSESFEPGVKKLQSGRGPLIFRLERSSTERSWGSMCFKDDILFDSPVNRFELRFLHHERKPRKLIIIHMASAWFRTNAEVILVDNAIGDILVWRLFRNFFIYICVQLMNKQLQLLGRK